MKEKIKNFLLKIKKSLCTEIKTPVYKIMLFGIIMIVLSCISFSCANFVTNTLNDIQTEQVEETSQTESMRIDRDINLYGYTYDDNITFGGVELVTDSPYTNIYFNTALETEYVTNRLVSMLSLFDVMDDGSYYYSFCNFSSSVTDNTMTLNIIIVPFPDDINSSLMLYAVTIIGVSSNGNTYALFVNYPSLFGLDNSLYNGFAISNGDLTSYGLAGGINMFYSHLSTYSIDYVGNNGYYSNIDFSWLVSRTPFTISSTGASTPQLENAPTELVNTLPTNALTTAPSGLGTLVYDTGSNFVELPTGSNANTLGVQIYYKSTWNQTTTDTYVVYEGINYYYSKPTPTITLSEVNVVIYTLWDDTTIYYNVGNVLDTPLTDYAVTSFDFFNWFNMFYSSVNVIQEYSDYWHLDFDIDYQVEYQNKVTAEYGNVISYVDYGFEMLIPHNVSLTDIGYKGFSMEKFIELDSNYNSAYIWIGEQTATNFVNQVFNRLYDNAYEDGDSDGFARGFDLNGDAYENATNPIFNFISKGASIISNVLNVEVLPNITLGTIFLFPLVIAMIWFVVKLFMGG